MKYVAWYLLPPIPPAIKHLTEVRARKGGKNCTGSYITIFIINNSGSGSGSGQPTEQQS